MKKEWILSEDEKKTKREKIVENRNKKIIKLNHGTGRESRLSMDNYGQDSSLSSDDNYSPPQSALRMKPQDIKREPLDGEEMTTMPLPYHQQQNPSPQSYHHARPQSVFDQATSAYHQQYQQYLSTKTMTNNRPLLMSYASANKADVYASPPPPQHSNPSHLSYHQPQSSSSSQSIHPVTTATASFGSHDSNTSDSVSPTSDCSYSTSSRVTPAFPQPTTVGHSNTQHQQHPSYDYQQHRSTYNDNNNSYEGEISMRRNTLPADYSRYNVSPGTVNYRHKLTKSYVDSMANQQQHQQYRNLVSPQRQPQSYGVLPAHQQSPYTSHSSLSHQQQQQQQHSFKSNTTRTPSQHFFEEPSTFNTFYHGRNFENGSTEVCGETHSASQSRLIKQGK